MRKNKRNRKERKVPENIVEKYKIYEEENWKSSVEKFLENKNKSNKKDSSYKQYIDSLQEEN